MEFFICQRKNNVKTNIFMRRQYFSPPCDEYKWKRPGSLLTLPNGTVLGQCSPSPAPKRRAASSPLDMCCPGVAQLPPEQFFPSPRQPGNRPDPLWGCCSVGDVEACAACMDSRFGTKDAASHYRHLALCQQRCFQIPTSRMPVVDLGRGVTIGPYQRR